MNDFRMIETKNDVLRSRLGDMKGSIKMALLWLTKSHRSDEDIEKAINALKEVKL